MTRILMTTVLFLAAACLVLPATHANAQESADAKPANHTLRVGLQGYSPVSYFAAGRAEPGTASFSSQHNGVTYFFTSAKQVEAFNKNPEAFLPAYGGWCAFGMSVEDHFVVDPHSFEIVDGRLMLFLKNDEVNARALWNDANPKEVKAKADRFWETSRCCK